MRTFSPELLALLDAGTLDVRGMIRFDLGEGSYGFIRRAAPFGYEGLTYHPLPRGVLEISGFRSASGTSAEGFSLKLSESEDDGVTPDVIAQIEQYDYRDRPVTIYDLHAHPDTGAILGAPVPMKRGYINAITHTDVPHHIATIECESRQIDYSRTNARLRSTADQNRRFPGDRGLEHASLAGRIDLKWGRK